MEQGGSASALSRAQREMAEQFIADHGPEDFELLMRSGAMMGDLRNDSKWALKSAVGAYEEHASIVLMTRIHRDAKRSGERVEMRLVSGDARLVVDFPTN